MHNKCGGNRSVRQPLGSIQHGLRLVPEDLLDGFNILSFCSIRILSKCGTSPKLGAIQYALTKARSLELHLNLKQSIHLRIVLLNGDGIWMTAD
jgi:hypothetical protein